MEKKQELEKKKGKIKMKLYHVSFDLDFKEEFAPRVPQCLKETSSENRTIPRICFSTSIEGCLSAIPGASGEEEMADLYATYQNIIRVYELETDDYALTEDDIMWTENIYSNGYVVDAYNTDEVWVLKNIKMKREDSYLAYIEGFDVRAEECVPKAVMDLAEEVYEDDVHSAYFEMFPNASRVPSVDVIDWLELIGGKDTTYPIEMDASVIDAYHSLDVDDLTTDLVIEELMELESDELEVDEQRKVVKIYSQSALEHFLKIKRYTGRINGCNL